MHFPKPWYRSARDAWYVEIGGSQVKLAEGEANEAEAFAEYHRLMHARGQLVVSADCLPFANLADLFLAACFKERSRSTYDWYKGFLDDFCGTFTGLVSTLSPSHVTAWMASHEDWSQSTCRGAVIAIKRTIGWGIKEAKLIKEDPLTGLKRPEAGRREVCAGAADMSAIVAETDAAFAAFVLAVRETGARPGEVRKVEARQFDPKEATWTFAPAECIKKSKRPRVFYLTDAMVALSKSLAEMHPEGPMFRNSRGKPWTKNAVVCRMRRLRAKGIIPKGTVAYSFRHGFATDALANDVTTAQLAQLMGHSDTRMIDQNYGHLDQRKRVLREAARKAVG